MTTKQGGTPSPDGLGHGASPTEQQIERRERLAQRLEAAAKRRQPGLLWWISILTAANLVSAALLYLLSLGAVWVVSHGEQAGQGLADFIIGVVASAAFTGIVYAVQRVKKSSSADD